MKLQMAVFIDHVLMYVTEDGITIFAPSEDAFRFFSADLEEVKANKTRLRGTLFEPGD
jgi:hypothetical protein